MVLIDYIPLSLTSSLSICIVEIFSRQIFPIGTRKSNHLVLHNTTLLLISLPEENTNGEIAPTKPTTAKRNL